MFAYRALDTLEIGLVGGESFRRMEPRTIAVGERIRLLQVLDDA
jgi:hypothetical protein